MLRMKTRLRFFALASLALLPPGGLIAREGVTPRPATVAEATKVLDLETFPLMPGAKTGGPRRLARLDYSAKGDPRGAYAFQKKALEERGWKELPGGTLSDMACFGVFGKDAFTVSVYASPGYGPDSEGMVQIELRQYGNVDLGKLPVPPEAKLLYSFPSTVSYVTEKSVKETAETLKKLLTAQGW